MEFQKEKTVRFYSDGGQRPPCDKPNIPDSPEVNELPPSIHIPSPLLKSNSSSKIFATPGGKSNVFFPEEHEPWRKRILDPSSELVLKWNKIFLFTCLVALFIDPLYFYLLSVERRNEKFTCLKMDLKKSTIVTCFRTVADLFYLLHIVIKFRMAYVAPSSRVSGRGELVTDPQKIAVRYLRSDFFIDLAAALPLPQIVVWFTIAALREFHEHTNNALVLIVLFQYIPRLYLIFPLSSEIIKFTGVVTKTAWAGAAYNLLLYILASHVLGASWYLLSIERLTTCWKTECRKVDAAKCKFEFFNCSKVQNWAINQSVLENCDPGEEIQGSIPFKFGIFKDALDKNVVSSEFLDKYLYCLWWGLQNLSSYGQNLKTSTFVGETLFAILIAILGLVLFAHLIGNMQTYLQSITVRLEEWRLKRRDTEEWMRHRQLPTHLRERVRRFVQYKWLATRGVDEESILLALPADLRRDIQRHLCLDLVRRVPFFSQMDDQLLDAICKRLVSSLSTEGTYIVREGDPVTEMLFIIRGQLESSTTNGGRTGFFNSITLRPGDFCGEELLAWALLSKSTLNLPSSTRTVKALVEVEAFALQAVDLKFVANQFRRLHSKKLQHTFRFYSSHWRTWAACFIQAAWRRFKRRKMETDLSIHESLSKSPEHAVASNEHEEEINNASCENPPQARQNLGVTILASKFAASTRRGAQKIKDAGITKLQKPEEPDFSAEPDDDS
ncbi:Cyclic nucleotide-binding domain-containing protein [Cinnamomum micranthum f. kanehirae]|uniref:Cyclic nucleotide-binding domain-containing protein n=1 Tax=Cinnamomum micranthum f. kanehirae TaxID=337451 RepID=A0A3S3QCQ4_9MAGN|nr:Cyclic nucleotide-binding domain-containing protein [Cinnamomum micranthum f. kanehirae]